MPRRRSLPSLAVLLFLVAACSEAGSAGPGAWTATTDTLGDTIVVRTTSGSVWKADRVLEEELRIGVVDGQDAYAFGRIHAVAADADGRIYVVDYQVPAVRVYDAAGVHLFDAGQQGGGPGEYERPRGVAFLSNGDWAVYDDLRRVNVYQPDGAFRTSFPVSSRFSDFSPLFGDSLDGVYHATTLEEGGERTRAFVRVPLAGGQADTVLEPSDASLPQPIEVPIDGGMLTVRPPLSPTMRWIVDNGGNRVYGSGAEYAVTVERTEGSLRIERQVAAVPISEPERQEGRTSYFAGVRSMAPDFRWSGDYPVEKPFFQQLATDADGRIWVKLHMPSVRREVEPPVDAEPGTEATAVWEEVQRWDVFEADGGYLGAVDMPDGFVFQFARGDHVWGVTRDEYRVEYVVRMRMVQQPPPAP